MTDHVRPARQPQPQTRPPRTLRELVATLGIAPEEIARAEADGTLGLLAISRFIFPGEPKYTQAEVEELTGLGEHARRWWHALGFTDPPPGEKAFTDADVDMLKVVRQMLDLGLVDEDVTLQMARVIGASMARIVAAQIDAIESRPLSEESAPITTGEGIEAEPALLRAGLLQTTMPHTLEYAWRRHLQVAARKQMVRDEVAAGGGLTTAVGFADLVGFTALSQQLDHRVLAGIVDHFEETAYDVVGAHGGRVVKMIGDEVMFAVDDLRAAVEIGLTLAELYQDYAELSGIRVGLASGPVLSLSGDLFGPTVNLASRIVSVAYESSVVVSADIHDHLAHDPTLHFKALRTRFLKGIGRVRLYVVRRAADVDEGVFERAWRRRGGLRDRVTDIIERRGDHEAE
jgi:adenylate cyclase